MPGGRAEPLIDPQAPVVLLWRWAVFLIAAGYCIYQLVIAGDYGPAGGPFRFLTIWALLLSFFAASRMLAVSEGRSERDWSDLVLVAAVANALVVLLYWRLWFEDPALVQTGGPPAWHQDYYLHLVGPVLQWIDALFVFGGIRRIWRGALWLVLAMAAYVAWIELFVQRFNDFPYGRMASGLPYPFLNDLDLPGRVSFYGTTAATALVLVVVFGAVAAGIRRRAAAQSSARSARSPAR